MPAEYNRLDTRVREIETDFAKHEGRNAAFWEDQSRTNTATLYGLEKLVSRTDTIEKKFSWVWGAAAGVTGLIGIVFAIASYFT
jgi:hypothetical protein